MGTPLAWDPDARYRELLARATADPAVVGVVVFGSHGAAAFVSDDSDIDAFVIVDGPPEAAQRWLTPHGSPVEIWAMTLDEFRAHALPGRPDAWNRPAFLRNRIDLDRVDGEIERIVGHATNLLESTDLMGYGWTRTNGIQPVISRCDMDALR